MGLQDRDYTREEDGWGYGEYGSRPNSVQSMTVALIVVNVGLYLADNIFSSPARPHELMRLMSLSPESVGQPWMWWQFLTAAFAHSPNTLNHILGNMFGLFIFGRDVEAKLGRYEFLRFYLVAAILGNVLWGVSRYFFEPPEQWNSLLGASGATSAVLVLYVCYFPRNTLLLFFMLAVPAWVVAAIFFVNNVLGAFGSVGPGQMAVAHDVHLAGAAVALAYWRFSLNFGALTPTEWLASAKRWLRRPRLKIHDPEPTYENLDAEADRVLAKLHSEGEASLNPRERRVLEDYSRRMRQKLR